MVNTVLLGAIAIVAGAVAGSRRARSSRSRSLAVVAGATVNLILLRRRFAPLEDLIEEMEKVDLIAAGSLLPASIDGIGETEEVERIELAFLRMMRRLEAERRRAGSAALRGPGGGAGAGRARPPRRGQPVADRAAAAARGGALGGAAGARAGARRDQGARQPGDARAAHPGPAASARPRSTTSAWRRRSRGWSSGSARARWRRRSRSTATSPTSATTPSWSSTGSPRRRSPTRRATPAPAHVAVALRRGPEGVELTVVRRRPRLRLRRVRARARHRRHARARPAGRRRADDRVPPRRRHHGPPHDPGTVT